MARNKPELGWRFRRDSTEPRHRVRHVRLFERRHLFRRKADRMDEIARFPAPEYFRALRSGEQKWFAWTSGNIVRQLFSRCKGLNLKVMGEELSLGRSVGSGAYGKENGRV